MKWSLCPTAGLEMLSALVTLTILSLVKQCSLVILSVCVLIRLRCASVVLSVISLLVRSLTCSVLGLRLVRLSGPRFVLCCLVSCVCVRLTVIRCTVCVVVLKKRW